MKTYNDILNENVFNQKTMRFTASQIKTFSRASGKKKTKQIIDFVYDLYIKDKEDTYQRHQHYIDKDMYTKDDKKLIDFVIKYFKQSMFLGFANFEQTKINLEKAI